MDFVQILRRYVFDEDEPEIQTCVPFLERNQATDKIIFNHFSWVVSYESSYMIHWDIWMYSLF